MHEPFVGTWKLNPARSAFDPNHRPTEGTMRLRREDDGTYLLEAEGRNEKGDPCAERPQRPVAVENELGAERWGGLSHA